MAFDADPPERGLRERKKRRTRSTLVDVAAELCLRQGYDKTTVEQIAAAADVSPRTFSRYFPTKESVIAAIADEIDECVAAALETQPLDINEHEALLRAHLEIFSPDGPYAPAAFNRMAVMIQIVNASPTLSGAAFAIQQGHASRSTIVLGRRMGMPPDQLPVRLVADTWTVDVRVGTGRHGCTRQRPDRGGGPVRPVDVDVRRLHPDLGALACRFGTERVTPRRRAVGIAITLT